MGGLGTDWARAFREQARLERERRARAKATRDDIRERRRRLPAHEELPTEFRREVSCERCGAIGMLAEMIVTETGHRCQDCEDTTSTEIFEARGVRRAVWGSLGLTTITAAMAFTLTGLLVHEGPGLNALVLIVPLVYLAHAAVAWGSAWRLVQTATLEWGDGFSSEQRRDLLLAAGICFVLGVLPLLMAIVGIALQP